MKDPVDLGEDRDSVDEDRPQRQGLAAFPNSTIQGTRHFSQEQTSLQRMLRFGLVEAPKCVPSYRDECVLSRDPFIHCVG